MPNPKRIGGYAVLNKIGDGGFGTVYRAYGLSSGRAVALKTLNPERADSDDIERFRREALLTAEINHPNVIRILDEGEDGGVHFIAMEMMALSLSDALSTGSLPMSRAMDICRQAALGLKAAHDRDVIHRDVKPANILIDSNGTVNVSDFGIAHADSLPNLTATGVGIGTMRYMSPEQIKDSKRVDARADVYSLGVTLYEMLTGKSCDLGESAKASRRAIPSELGRIVDKCIEPDRENRYANVDDLLREIANPALINRCALIDFYEATNGDNWNRNDNWLTDAPLGSWYGVTANHDGVVTHLDASSGNLEGEIPSEIAHLTELTGLGLQENRLSGSIPPELGNLTKLRGLALYENRLSGNIPPELGNLTKLEILLLNNNRLSGSIPPELCNLTELISLELYENRLSGSIPPELCNLTELEDLTLGDNCLSGNIPPELGNLTKLERLDLEHNRLSGNVPPELCNLTKLAYLSLVGNNWTGCIPRVLFDISDNDLNKINLPICEG